MQDSAVEIVPTKKRGGRKPGSKNRPKDEPQELALLKARIVELESRPVATPVQAIALLEQAVAVRVSAMDSERKLGEKVDQLKRLAAEALGLLRGAL